MHVINTAFVPLEFQQEFPISPAEFLNVTRTLKHLLNAEKCCIVARTRIVGVQTMDSLDAFVSIATDQNLPRAFGLLENLVKGLARFEAVVVGGEVSFLDRRFRHTLELVVLHGHTLLS